MLLLSTFHRKVYWDWKRSSSLWGRPRSCDSLAEGGLCPRGSGPTCRLLLCPSGLLLPVCPCPSLWCGVVAPSASTHPSRPSSDAPASQESSNPYPSHLHLGFPSFMLGISLLCSRNTCLFHSAWRAGPVSFPSIIPTKPSTKLVISWCPVHFVELYWTWPLLEWVSLGAQLVKNPPAMLETWVRSLSWEDHLEKIILAWRIPWTV